MKLIFATRPSALARWQTHWVIQALQGIYPDLQCEEKIITTQGDKILDKPLPEIGGKGLFTQELESELLSGAVHCAVHSLKDLPVENPEGLTIGCIPVRADVRDALISKNGFELHALPPEAIVGTSSLRRAAQLRAVRPDLKTESLRGNVDTRLRKALDGQYDAIILAVTRLTSPSARAACSVMGPMQANNGLRGSDKGSSPCWRAIAMKLCTVDGLVSVMASTPDLSASSLSRPGWTGSVL